MNGICLSYRRGLCSLFVQRYRANARASEVERQREVHAFLCPQSISYQVAGHQANYESFDNSISIPVSALFTYGGVPHLWNSKILEMILSADIHWFPMRVTYGRELAIKNYLEKMNVQCFLPMRYDVIETKEGSRRQLVPAVSNLIFVRSTQRELTRMKMYDKNLEPLRYMIRKYNSDKLREIITVSDAAMDNFIKVTKGPEEKVFYLEPNDFVTNLSGRRVTITTGPFAGVEGVIKRIQGNKHVVVQLDKIMAAAITYIPAEYLVYS